MVSGWNGTGTAPSSYYNALWNKSKNITISAFQQATISLASFWYTAYINAGKLKILPSPAQINFAEISPGSSILDSVTITNITAETLMVSVANPDTQNFQIFPLSSTIMKGSSRKFYVTFKPSITGTFSENIIFNHNLNIPPIQLSVNGVSSQRTFSLNRNNLNFSNAFVGESRIDSIIVLNTSGLNLNLSIINPDILNFSVSPINLSIPKDSVSWFYVTFHPKITGDFETQFIINHNLGSNPLTFAASGKSTMFSISFNIKSNWNLISVPLKTFDSMFVSLFSNSIFDYVYSYKENGYQRNYNVENGVGYWAKFPQAQTVVMPGVPLYMDTVNLNIGWNIIGSISNDLTINNLLTEPSDLVISNFYGYGDGYFIAETLKSGSAYWVKANKAGKLILSTHLKNQDHLNIDTALSNPPIPSGLREELVENYHLSQNFPNPFNPITKIEYFLTKSAYVKLMVFDVLGKEVVRLIDGWQESGRRSVIFDGKDLPSGIYFYKLIVNGEANYTNVKKMSLIK